MIPEYVLGISAISLVAIGPSLAGFLTTPPNLPPKPPAIPTVQVVVRAPSVQAAPEAVAASIVAPPQVPAAAAPVQYAVPVNPPTQGIAAVVSPPAPVRAAPVAPATVAPAAPVVKVVPETPAALRPHIVAAAARHGIPSDVLSAALARESANFKEKYVYGWHVDGTGRGIAGIDKKYHPEVSDEQAFDPIFAINWEAEMLASLKKKNKGDLYSALREYNGGENFASSRIGYQGRTVASLTKAHADAIMSHAAKAIPVS